MARIPTQPTTESGLPALVPHGRFKGKPAMHLGRPVTVIGARNRSHLHLVSPAVSKSHAMVVNTGAGFYVRDLASRTHIYVNGQEVKEAELRDGDIIGVGPFTFRFTDPERRSSKPAPPPAGVLRLSNRALPMSLDSRVTMIGRRPTCDLAIDEAEVSTTHAVIFEMNGKRFLRDLGSRTGTFINGTAVHQQPLEFGDTIRIGSVEMVYAAATADELVGVGSGLLDEDDLTGTAKLPAQDAEEAPFERPAARPLAGAGAAAPHRAGVGEDVGGTALAGESTDELDLSLEPAPAAAGDVAAPATAENRRAEAPASEEPAEDLTFEPVEPEPVTAAPAVTRVAPQDSSIGIDLLPHDAAEAAPPAPAEPAGLAGLDLAAEPTADHAPTPPAGEPDFGLDFAEPTPAPAPSVPAPGPSIDAEAAAPPPPEDDLAPNLEPVDLDRLEVVEKTEPTPESAIALDDLLPADEAARARHEPTAAGAEAMTDSVFGREVTAFGGPGFGPLVEAGPADDTTLSALPMAEPGEPPTASDPLIYDEPTAAPPVTAGPPAAEAAPEEVGAAPEAPEPVAEAAASDAEAALANRRGGRKPAAPKGAKKAAVPKRKAPARKPPTPAAEAEDVAAGAAAAASAAGAIEAKQPPAAETPAETVAETVPASSELEALPAERDLMPPAEAAPAVLVEEAVEPSAPVVAEVAEPAEPAVAAEPTPPTVIDEPRLGEAEQRDVTPLAAEPAIDLTPDVPAPIERSSAERTPAEPLTLEPEPPTIELDLAGPSTSATAAEPADLAPPVAGEGVDETSEKPVAPFEAAGAAEPFAETAAGAGEVPVAEQPQEQEAPSGPQRPADLFFGLERDTASFLGGMPLQLPPLQSPFASQGPVDSARPPEPEVREASAEPAELDEPELLALDEDDDLLDEVDAGGAAAPAADERPPIAPAPAVAAAPASPFRPAPPPPARSGPGRERPGRPGASAAPQRPPGAPAAAAAASSPFDLNFEDVPTDRIEIPPFAGPGPATRSQVTTAFDGLAMPPVREADVFSQRPVGDTTIPPFAGPAPAAATAPPAAAAAIPPGAKAESTDDDLDDLDIEPLDLSTADDGIDDSVVATDDEDDEPVGVDSAAARPAARGEEQPREPRKPWQPVGPSRRPPAYPADPAGGRPGAAAPAKKKKKRWRIGKWGLFGLMLVSMGVASLAIWYGWPRPTAAVTGRIEFAKLDTLPEARRQQVLAEQRMKLQRPEVRASAREILASHFAGLTPGFLAETGTPAEVRATAATFDKILRSMRAPEKKPVILVTHQALDGDADGKRMLALLQALHAENKPLIDQEGELSRALDKKREELLQAQIAQAQLQPALGSARAQLGDRAAITEKQALVDALRQKEADLSAAWNEATARVKQLTADALAAESAVPFDPDADLAAAPPSADEDPQAVEMARRADELSARIADTKQRRTARAEEARQAMATALKQFEDDIAKARAEMKPDTELGRYVEAASGVQRQLKIVSGELAQQQRSDMERLAMLKQKLAEKNEARIRRAFAADPELQSMQEQLALKERQYNTAAAGGLKDDARALEKQVKTLRTEIESRQDLLTTADGVAPDMKDLEAFITDTLARMEKDRARNDRIMADHLKELTAKAPAAGSLPAEQKAFAEQLERRQAELNKAREGYAAAVEAAAAEADEDVKSLEAELAAVQAKLDERKKQVAEAARNTLPEDQQRERVALTEASRRALDAAQKADEEAAAAYLANRRSLADAEAQLERVQGQASSFDRENAKAAEASRRVVAVGDEVDQLRRRLDAAIVPVKPTDEHVAVAPQGPDRRVIYVLGTCLVLALVYGPLVAAAPLHPKPQEPAGETLELVDSFDGGVHGFGTVPFAAPAARDADEPALAAARAMEDATDDQHGRRPGGSAVPV